MGSITIIDWGIWLVYFTLIALVLWVYRLTKRDDHYRYFIRAFLIKVAGGVLFAMIYVYYYQFGDTFLYHRGAMVMSDTLLDNPADYFRLLFSTNDNLPKDLWQVDQLISYSRGAEEWFMVKLLSPVTILTFGSYLVTTLLTSLISFWGGWKLFLVFQDILPKRKNLAFIAVFLVPSSLFWGGGIMKDTFTLALMSYIIYALYFTVFKRQFSLTKYIGISVAVTIVFLLKGYIILAFVPAILIGINGIIRTKIDSIILKRTIDLVLVTMTAGIIYIGPQFLSETTTKYNVESLESRVRGFHTWHTDIGGSSYNLGDVDYSAFGVVSKIPAALNVTFFRPYLWEARNPVVLIAAIESIVILFFCLMILYKLGFRFLKYIRKKPILMTFLIYTLVFGFIVGFTSYNFGALGRYKIPIYPIFVFIIFYLNHQGNLKLIERRESRR